MSRSLFGRQVDPLKLRWRNDLPFARKCGDCTMCCTAPEIDEPGYLEKPMGVSCTHLCEAGCSLFGAPARPKVCEEFACNWLRGDGTVHQRPDRMGAMPTLSEDRTQCVLYLAPGITPETLTREARAYVRHWHRKRKTAVLLLHGENYGTTTALWPDGVTMEQPTEVRRPGGAPEPEAAAETSDE